MQTMRERGAVVRQSRFRGVLGNLLPAVSLSIRVTIVESLSRITGRVVLASPESSVSVLQAVGALAESSSRRSAEIAKGSVVGK